MASESIINLIIMSSNTCKIIAISADTIEELKSLSDEIKLSFKNKTFNLNNLSVDLLKIDSKYKYRCVAFVDNNVENISWFDNIDFSLDNNNIAFLFGGQGSLYYQLGYGLYTGIPFVKNQIDACLDLIPISYKEKFKEILFSTSLKNELYTKLNHTYIFIIEYAIAKFLIEIGIIPNVLIGYSLGEFVAAAISEVLSLNEVLSIIIKREELISTTLQGSMLSVPLSKKLVKPFLNDELFIAIDNGDSCVVSGYSHLVLTLHKRLSMEKIYSVFIDSMFPFHSECMKGITHDFRSFIENKKIEYCNFKYPYISNVTGELLSLNEISQTDYWIKHLTQTVLFDKGLNEILKENNTIFVEIGIGKNIGMLLSRYIPSMKEKYYPTIRYSQDQSNDVSILYKTILKIHLSGFNVNLSKL